MGLEFDLGRDWLKRLLMTYDTMAAVNDSLLPRHLTTGQGDYNGEENPQKYN